MKLMMIKLFLTAITITAALTVTISTENIDIAAVDGQPLSSSDTAAAVVPPPRRKVSRFLAEEKNPRAPDHCKRNNEICYMLEVKNSTCCNNKCIDLTYERQNCGACNNKCKLTQTCCRGECVNLSFDKRHCGDCGNRCMTGGYCIYGMCNYA